MPIYEFTCKSCNKQFEELCRAGGEDEVKCLHCRSGDVERLISSFSFKSGNGGGKSSSSCGSCSKTSCSTCG